MSALHDPRYRQQHRFRGWNILPTVLHEPRLFSRVFPELTKADHLRLAHDYVRQSKKMKEAWVRASDAAEKKHGSHGSLISGGLRDYWPEAVKSKVRKLAHGYTELSSAAQAHWRAAGKRGHVPR